MIGLDTRTARRFAGFFYVSMMSVCGLMGLFVFQTRVIAADTGAGISHAGPRAGQPVPAFSGIRRP